MFDGALMTKERFNECLELLYWSQIDLAAILECDVFLTNAWSNGLEPVPADIAIWLEKLAKAHDKAGIPGWYKGAVRSMRGGGDSQQGKK